MRTKLGLLVLAAVTVTASACARSSEEEASVDEAPFTQTDRELGEQLEPNEAALVKEITKAATEQVVQSMEKSADKVARRDAHPKAHGCVTGSFQVNANVPADLAIGTFTPGKRYDTWIRFSNGSKADDRENDARGMAMKLIGVEGERLLTGEEPTAKTHDLVLSNHHTFFISNLEDYVGFMKTVTEKGNPISFFLSWNPFDLHLREAWLARQFTTQPISSPVTSRYWSVTPYALGHQAVKYSVAPCGGVDDSGEHPDDADFLSDALKRDLATKDACFDFMIQRREYPEDMPVEDPTVTWDESDAPFVKVARVTIPMQTFDSPAQQTFCENLSFSPWHGTKEHRPLGSTNRTRKVVYEATSAARHRLNGVARVEPTDLTVK